MDGALHEIRLKDEEHTATSHVDETVRESSTTFKMHTRYAGNLLLKINYVPQGGVSRVNGVLMHGPRAWMLPADGDCEHALERGEVVIMDNLEWVICDDSPVEYPILEPHNW